MAESEEKLLEKLGTWKKNMEEKRLRVNLGKTKVMRCCDAGGQREVTGKYPCAVCMKGVGSNSVECTVCKKWVHKKCSGVKEKLREGLVGYKCPICSGQVQRRFDDGVKEVELSGSGKLECVNKFCYLGDVIGSGGGASDASRNRVRCAWGKFNQLQPMLARRGASLRIKGKIYAACVQSVLVYGSETWPMRVEEVRRMERTERAMVRRMCGVTLSNRIKSEEVNKRLGIVGVMETVRKGLLRWFGHVERKEGGDWVSRCRDLQVDGKGCRGRGKKTWRECVNEEMKKRGVRPELAKHRDMWRSCIHGNAPTRAEHGKGRIKR